MAKRWLLFGMAGVWLGGCLRTAVPSAEVPTTGNGGPTLGEFAPGTADPTRKKALEALAPKLDAFFESKLKETGATGLAAGIVLEGELV